jgi:hypothetical protein
MADSTADIASGSVYFSWDNVGEAMSYALQVSNDESFINRLLNQNLSENFYAFQNSAINGGRYYWRVSYVSQTLCGPRCPVLIFSLLLTMSRSR